MRNKHIKIAILLIATFTINVSAQFTRPNDWKKVRKELSIGIGAAQFLGDLGGLNKIGTDFSPVDLEFSLTRPALSLAYRYKILKNFNVQSSFNYLLVAGDDKLTTDIYRNNRNLNFKSNIFEFATRVELAYLSGKKGNRYGIKRTLGRRHKGGSWELTGFIGIGVFYFNPKGKTAAGDYIELKELHTEGQGLAGGPKQYKNYAVSIPMGASYRRIIKRQWSVGVEINYRKTFTDYIDDVSTVYYNKTSLATAYGPLSAQMADPSLGNIPGATSPNADGTSAQRGDKEKDTFIGVQVTVGKFFAPKRGKSRLRSKF